MAEYSIAQARPSDLHHLPEIELAAARMLVGHADDSLLSDVTPLPVRMAAQAEGRLWVALCDDVPVGFAHVEILEPAVVHLEEIDVHPDHGRRGLGRRLVAEVCRWAGAHGCTAVTLTTFRDVPWNMPFYARVGFEEVATDALSPALRAVRDDERRRGLDWGRRVAMRCRLPMPNDRIARHHQIRRASVNDRPHLLALWERSVRATHHFLAEHDIVMLRPLVAEELASAEYDWWVAELPNGLVIGILGYATDTIEGLFVDPDYRGTGAGTALVAHAERISTGPLRVDVNEQNAEAREFYRRHGFVVVGRSATDGAGRAFPLLHMSREP